jgi:nucleoside-diphosphate-sugar epimerase
MRIFVTGGTGYIGSAVVGALVRAGHSVTGLARSPERAAHLETLGAQSVLGTLRTPAAYAAIATEQDASVHLGFESGAEASNADRTAVDTLLTAARAAGRPYAVVYTSGVLVLGPAGTSAAYEDAPTDRAAFNIWRPGHERVVLAANSSAVTTVVIRPGWVYGGGEGVLADYFQSAWTQGAAAFVGEGRNRMPLVQREEVAALYRLALERRATGILHGVEGGTGTISDYAAAASRAAGKGGAVRSIPLDEAKRTLGPFAEAMCLDQWVGSRRAQSYGWNPGPPFLDRPGEAFADWRRAQVSP